MRIFKRYIFLLAGLLFITVTAVASTQATPAADSTIYLPAILKPDPPPLQEFRGLWVSRYDWTSYGAPAQPAKLDEIVQNAALAGFNVIFFQVRGTADAYYTPGLEPWAQRVSGGAHRRSLSPTALPALARIARRSARRVWRCNKTPGSAPS